MKHQIWIWLIGLCGSAFAQTASITSVSSPACAGDSIFVTYSVSGSFNSGNSFKIILSDEFGNFPGSVIGEKQTNQPGTIACFISQTTVAGSSYKLRIKSTSPQSVADYVPTLTVFHSPITIFTFDTTEVNYGTPVLLQTAFTGVEYQWLRYGSPIPGATSSTFNVVQSGGYSLLLKDAVGCHSLSDTIAVTVYPVQSNPNPPNIILFMLDDVAFNYFGETGAPGFIETPNIDSFARSGANFTQAFANYSFCIPSRASMLTGLYPHINGAIANNVDMSAAYITVAEILHDAGYYCAQMGKYHWINKPQPGYDYWFACDKFDYIDPNFNYNGTNAIVEGHYTDILTDTAVSLINELGQPYFLLIQHLAAHSPTTPRAEESMLYSDVAMNLPGNFEPFENNYPTFLYESNEALDDSATVDAKKRSYNQVIAGADASLGQIMQALEATNQLDSTLIIFISDNGYLFGEHYLAGKKLAYEESIRIPLMIRYPAWFSGNTIVKDNIALNMDVASTILDAAGITDHYGMQGFSLRELAENTKSRSEFMYESFGNIENEETFPNLRAVRSKEYKYVIYACSDTTEEFFDLIKDPLEKTNLINDPAFQTLIQSYRDKLTDMRDELGDTFSLYNPLWPCVTGGETSGPTFSLFLKPTDETCHAANGKITTTTTGGTSPFTYLWNNGATTKNLSNATAGTYTLTATDANGYIVRATETIVNANKILAYATPVETIVCPGSSVQLSGSVNRLSKKSKFVNKKIKDNDAGGLSSTINTSGFSGATLHSVEVTIQHPRTADLTLQLICPDGSMITLCSNVGGEGDYFLSTYFCDTASTMINEGIAPFSSVFQSETSLSTLNTCNMNGAWKLKIIDGEANDVGYLMNWSITFALPGTNVNFAWSPATYLNNSTILNPVSTPGLPIEYVLTADDGAGCEDSSEVEIELYSPISPVISADGPVSFCAGDNVTLEIPASTYSGFQWKKNDIDISSATSYNYTASDAGNYSVSAVDSNGCVVTSNSVAVTIICKTGNITPGIKVFPNPFLDELNIVSESETSLLLIVNSTGSTVYESRLKGGLNTIQTGELVPGLYMLKLLTGSEVQIIPVVKD